MKVFLRIIIASIILSSALITINTTITNSDSIKEEAFSLTNFLQSYQFIEGLKATTSLQHCNFKQNSELEKLATKTIDIITKSDLSVENPKIFFQSMYDIIMNILKMYDCPKSTETEALRNFSNLSEGILFYLPQNFATILASYEVNHKEIIDLINSSKDLRSFAKNIVKIIELLFKDAHHGDKGYESFVELRTFDNCFGRMIASYQYGEKFWSKLHDLIQGKITVSKFLSYLSDVALIFTNEVKGCQDFNSHVEDLVNKKRDQINGLANKK